MGARYSFCILLSSHPQIDAASCSSYNHPLVSLNKFRPCCKDATHAVKMFLPMTLRSHVLLIRSLSDSIVSHTHVHLLTASISLMSKSMRHKQLNQDLGSRPGVLNKHLMSSTAKAASWLSVKCSHEVASSHLVFCSGKLLSPPFLSPLF